MSIQTTPSIYTVINKNNPTGVYSSLPNSYISNLIYIPSNRPINPTKGQQYYDNTYNLIYYWDGTTWVSGGGGSQGYQGLIGISGSTGTNGVQGYQGLIGSTGSKGNDGLQGYQGVIGVTGSKGNDGLQGYQGYQGLVGTTGTNGVQGVQGYQGLVGPTGAGGGFIQMIQLLDNVQSSTVSGQAIVPNWTVPFILNGGKLMFTTSFSCFSTVVGLSTFDFLIDGSVVANTRFYFNNTSIHLTIPSLFNIENISAGSHTGAIRIPTGVTVDSGDYCNMSLIEVLGANSIGLTGPTGTAGSIGTQGLQGLRGATGSQGFQGLTGGIGPQGLQGNAGPTGTLTANITFTQGNNIPVNADVDNYSLTEGALFLMTGSGGVNFNGIANGVIGRYLVLLNNSAGNVVFKQEALTSTTTNRFSLSTTQITVGTNSAITFIYGSTTLGNRWICLSKQ